jgi:hypothetical protein
MPLLLGRCTWLKAQLLELMGEAGRRYSIFDEDDIVRGRPDAYRSREPWLADQQHPWVAFVLAQCQPLRQSVAAIRGVRDELARAAWASETLRENLRAYLECGLLVQPWLVEVADGETYTKYDSDGELHHPAYETILVTAPVVASRLDCLIVTVHRSELQHLESRCLQNLPKRL